MSFPMDRGACTVAQVERRVSELVEQKLSRLPQTSDSLGYNLPKQIKEEIERENTLDLEILKDGAKLSETLHELGAIPLKSLDVERFHAKMTRRERWRFWLREIVQEKIPEFTDVEGGGEAKTVFVLFFFFACTLAVSVVVFLPLRLLWPKYVPLWSMFVGFFWFLLVYCGWALVVVLSQKNACGQRDTIGKTGKKCLWVITTSWCTATV